MTAWSCGSEATTISRPWKAQAAGVFTREDRSEDHKAPQSGKGPRTSLLDYKKGRGGRGAGLGAAGRVGSLPAAHSAPPSTTAAAAACLGRLPTAGAAVSRPCCPTRTRECGVKAVCVLQRNRI